MIRINLLKPSYLKKGLAEISSAAGSAQIGWVGLGVVGQRLANIASDFDPRTYGYRKLSDLVRKTGAFDIDQPEGRAMRIRAKPKPPSKTRAKATAAR